MRLPRQIHRRHRCHRLHAERRVQRLQLRQKPGEMRRPIGDGDLPRRRLRHEPRQRPALMSLCNHIIVARDLKRFPAQSLSWSDHEAAPKPPQHPTNASPSSPQEVGYRSNAARTATTAPSGAWHPASGSRHAPAAPHIATQRTLTGQPTPQGSRPNPGPAPHSGQRHRLPQGWP